MLLLAAPQDDSETACFGVVCAGYLPRGAALADTAADNWGARNRKKAAAPRPCPPARSPAPKGLPWNRRLEATMVQEGEF